MITVLYYIQLVSLIIFIVSLFSTIIVLCGIVLEDSFGGFPFAEYLDKAMSISVVGSLLSGLLSVSCYTLSAALM